MWRERTQMSLTLNYLKKNLIKKSDYKRIWMHVSRGGRGPNIIRFPKHLSYIETEVALHQFWETRGPS